MVKISDNLDDWNEYRGMVRWFSPRVLLHTLQSVIASTFFGRYADKRLVHASLDVANDAMLKERAGGPRGICPAKGPVWVDYVAANLLHHLDRRHRRRGFIVQLGDREKIAILIEHAANVGRADAHELLEALNFR